MIHRCPYLLTPALYVSTCPQQLSYSEHKVCIRHRKHWYMGTEALISKWEFTVAVHFLRSKLCEHRMHKAEKNRWRGCGNCPCWINPSQKLWHLWKTETNRAASLSHTVIQRCARLACQRGALGPPLSSQGDKVKRIFFLCSFPSLGNIMFSNEVTWPGTNMETQL